MEARSSNEEGQVQKTTPVKQRKRTEKASKEGKRPKTAKREYKEDASKVSKKDRLKEYMKSFGYDNDELAELYGMEDDDDGLGDMSYELYMASEQFDMYSRGLKEDNLVRKQKEDYLRMLHDAEYLMKELKQVEKQLIQLHLG
jgi:hypothetical protein